MLKRYLKRWMPEKHKLREHRHLQLFGHLLSDPNLWHLNRRSASGSFALGLFCAMLPIPMQMVVAAALAILIRVNLPISVALVWITNPLTMPPIFYFNYRIGTWLLDTPHLHRFEPTLEWFSRELAIIWQPLLAGSLVMGVVSAFIGFCFIRILWRLHIIRYLQHKQRERQIARSFSQMPPPRDE
jgi:uncharacterized protein